MAKLDEKQKYISRGARLLLLLVSVIVASSALFGCSFIRDIFTAGNLRFTRGTLTLQVGDVYYLGDIIESDSSVYTLSSSDPSVATVKSSSRMLTAKAVGYVTITAEAGAARDTLRLSVIERQPDSLTLSSTGELIQSESSMSSVTFMPTASGAAARIDVSWYVNDAFVMLQSPEKPFTFTPTGAGEYVVSARCGEYSDEITVRVYKPVTVSVEKFGELTQTTVPYTDVRFEVTVTGGAGNPDNYIVWYVDDGIVQQGSAALYVYKPTPGRHKIEVFVNGNSEYRGETYCRGAVIPDAPTVDFDNLYPHVYVRYDVKGAAEVEISTPYGDEYVFAQTDAAYADKFSQNGFDAGEIIELCASGNSRRTYKIRVRSLGDGDALTESAYSEYLMFTQLPSTAERYWSTVVPGGDLYITSDSEYVKIAEYYIISRPKTSPSTVSFDCYIAYDRQCSAEELWENTFKIAATSGTYTKMIAHDAGSGVMHTGFTVDTVNAPTKQSTASVVNGHYAEQLHAVLPHINFDESKYRPATYEFPIDKSENSIAVAYSDELYIAVQNGVRPIPAAGSAAETIYAMARDVLRKICTDDMTDVQKAHAIYDWIMWKVTYDTPATGVNKGGEALSAYYLEGVFGDGMTKINGVAYENYAVCDGMSKAYAMMCNMEGIECVRVVGTAGHSMQDAGGHAWNKVKLNGSWYAVDCTWGDSQGSLALDGSVRKAYELGLHDHLFLTDAQISGTHYEPYATGDSAIRHAPKTATTPIDVYSDLTFNGVSINCKIAHGEKQSDRIREIARIFARAYTKRTSITVPGGIDGGVYQIDYQGIEIYAEDGITASDTDIRTIAQSAIRSALPGATVRVVTLGDVILLLVK